MIWGYHYFWKHPNPLLKVFGENVLSFLSKQELPRLDVPLEVRINGLDVSGL